MPITVTRHSEHHTLTRDDVAREVGAPRSATHVVCWLSDDAQSDMWMGWGSSHDEALAHAQRECAEQGIIGGSLAVYDVV